MSAQALPLAAAVVAAALRDAAAEASLFLLVGGIVMLSVIVVLVLIQNIVPDRTPPVMPGARPTLRQLRALDGGPLAQTIAGARRANGRRRYARVAPVDLALDRVVELRLGEPRLLQAHERQSRLRLYACRGCSFSAAGGPGHACTTERAALEEVFGAVLQRPVRTVETACRRRGDPACEFEVAH